MTITTNRERQETRDALVRLSDAAAEAFVVLVAVTMADDSVAKQGIPPALAPSVRETADTVINALYLELLYVRGLIVLTTPTD